MILNERQYGITKTKIKEFEQAKSKLRNSPEPENLNEQLRHEAHLDTLNSQLAEFYEEVAEYEKLKEGKIENLKIDGLENLPEAIIKARIVRGLTQEGLAKRLGVKPQQVQRTEANRYASTSFTTILEIFDALNIELREELIFK
jgi:HTH-type transcriptional regulator / antitoxin HipB